MKNSAEPPGNGLSYAHGVWWSFVQIAAPEPVFDRSDSMQLQVRSSQKPVSNTQALSGVARRCESRRHAFVGD